MSILLGFCVIDIIGCVDDVLLIRTIEIMNYILHGKFDLIFLMPTMLQINDIAY